MYLPPNMDNMFESFRGSLTGLVVLLFDFSVVVVSPWFCSYVVQILSVTEPDELLSVKCTPLNTVFLSRSVESMVLLSALLTKSRVEVCWLTNIAWAAPFNNCKLAMYSEAVTSRPSVCESRRSSECLRLDCILSMIPILLWLGLLKISMSLSPFLLNIKSASLSQLELPATLWFESNELRDFDIFEHDDDSFNDVAEPNPKLNIISYIVS